MKNYFLFVLLFTFTYGFAQTEQPQDYKWTIGLQINTIEKIPPLGNGAILDGRFLLGSVEKNKSIAFGIMATCLSSKKYIYRLKIGYTKRNIVEDFSGNLNANVNYNIEHAVITQSNMKLSPGVQWSTSEKKIIFYGGFDLPFTSFGKMVIKNHTDVYSSDTLSYIEDDVLTIPKGMSIGVGTFSGFSVNIGAHFLIGSEVSFAYLYSIMGKGDTKMVATGNVPNGIPQVATFKYNDSIQKIGIFDLQGALNFFYKF